MPKKNYMWMPAATTLALAAATSPAISGDAHNHDHVKNSVTVDVELEHDEMERAVNAAAVLNEAVHAKDNAIPRSILEKASGIVVIPDVVKGAFIVGGQYGKGLTSWRGADGDWSAPSYVGMGGASYGFQAGVEKVDLVLVVVGNNALQELLADNLKLSATAGLTVGPIGREAEIGTNLTLDSGIYAYSHTKGLFAGISLDGAVVTVDDGANSRVYGEDVTAAKLLKTGDVDVNDTVRPFWDALQLEVPNTSS